MIKGRAKRTRRGNALTVTIPNDVPEATGLRDADELSRIARDDGVLEMICQAAPGEVELDGAFEWSLGRYTKSYEDLAK